MALIPIVICLPLFILAILGLIGLKKKRLIISAKRELSGIPMITLSCLYIVIALFSFIYIFYYRGDVVSGLKIALIAVVIVTLLALFKSNSRTN